LSAHKIPVSVLVVIHTADGQVLLMERADAPGFWQSVTGSQDAGEALVETAIREVREETGLDATQFELAPWDLATRYEIYERWRHRYAPGVTHNTEHVFGSGCRAAAGHPGARAPGLRLAAGRKRRNAAFPATRRRFGCFPRAYNGLWIPAAHCQLQHSQGPVAIQPAADGA
jgi:8-oxo-dGTP pyrophosphatase MutT (NUDIX family)